MFTCRGNIITLFMLARGLKPLGAEKNEETGNVEIYFPDEARLHLADYMAAKQKLTLLNELAESGQ